MIDGGPALSTSDFVALAPLLRAVSYEKLDAARRHVVNFERIELLQRYRAAYVDGKRLVAYVMAGELIARGIPPCFWHDTLKFDDASINERYDLTLADLAWLRRWHPDHARAVRYQRGKALLTGSAKIFHREAEFAFYQGKRPAWKLVGSLSMTERQQWDCAWLRSAPIKKRAVAIEAASARVLQALREELRSVRRTASFGEAEAQATLGRRHAIWHCARMVKDSSPTEIAARYEQMTGSPITRQAAANQLEKVRAVLRKEEMTL